MHPGRVWVSVAEYGRRAGPYGKIILDVTFRPFDVVVAGMQKQVDVVFGNVWQMRLRVHPGKKKFLVISGWQRGDTNDIQLKLETSLFSSGC